MDAITLDYSESLREWDAMSSSRLRGLAVDVRLLQRQLAIVLTEAGTDQSGDALALMVARGLLQRLTEGRILLKGLASQPPAVAAFERHVVTTHGFVGPGPLDALGFDADLADDLGSPRMWRLQALAPPTARAALLASRLFLAAADQILDTVSSRHEPEVGEAFEVHHVANDARRIA